MLNWLGGWVGPTADVDTVMVKKKVPVFAKNQILNIQPIASLFSD